MGGKCWRGPICKMIWACIDELTRCLHPNWDICQSLSKHIALTECRKGNTFKPENMIGSTHHLYISCIVDNDCYFNLLQTSFLFLEEEMQKESHQLRQVKTIHRKKYVQFSVNYFAVYIFQFLFMFQGRYSTEEEYQTWRRLKSKYERGCPAFRWAQFSRTHIHFLNRDYTSKHSLKLKSDFDKLEVLIAR